MKKTIAILLFCLVLVVINTFSIQKSCLECEIYPSPTAVENEYL